MRAASLLVAAILLQAQAVRLPEPYQAVVDLARAAPPEFAADAMLRLVESRKIADRNAQRGLVEDAFHLARSAKFPVRMRGLPGTTTDTRSGFLSQSYDLKLDALSLQSRAVRDMLAIDVPAARELFLGIPRPALTPLTCDDAVVYDVTDYYQALGAIVANAFDAKERAKEDHVNFLLDYLGQAASPAQLVPLAGVIKGAGVTPQQREILWTRFNGLLESLAPDGRSFAASMGPLNAEVPAESQASFEKYKQKNEGCKDDAPANRQARQNAPTTPKLERYWQSPEALRLLQAGVSLRATSAGQPLSDAERSTPEWQRQLVDYLGSLAGWTPAQEKAEADYYHQKCIIYEALVELIPPGPQRDKMLNDFVSFISNSNLQQQSPVEWFLHANSMLERVRHTNNGEPSKVLAAYENSGNAVLSLEVRLERVLGPKPTVFGAGSN